MAKKNPKKSKKKTRKKSKRKGGQKSKAKRKKTSPNQGEDRAAQDPEAVAQASAAPVSEPAQKPEVAAPLDPESPHSPPGEIPMEPVEPPLPTSPDPPSQPLSDSELDPDLDLELDSDLDLEPVDQPASPKTPRGAGPRGGRGGSGSKSRKASSDAKQGVDTATRAELSASRARLRRATSQLGKPTATAAEPIRSEPPLTRKDWFIQFGPLAGVGVLILLLAAFSFLTPWSLEVEVPEFHVKTRIEYDFPIGQDLDSDLAIILYNAEVSLIDQTDQINFRAGVYLKGRRMEEAPRVEGELEGTCGLVYDPEQRRVFLTLSTIDTLVLRGEELGIDRRIRTRCKEALNSYFGRRSLHRLKPSEVRGRGDAIEVESFEIEHGMLRFRLKEK